MERQAGVEPRRGGRCREDTTLTIQALREDWAATRTSHRLEREVESHTSENRAKAVEIKRLNGEAKNAQRMHQGSRAKVAELQDALRRAIAAAREANGRVASLRAGLAEKVGDYGVAAEQVSVCVCVCLGSGG